MFQDADGSLFLICVFALGRNKVTFWRNKQHMLFLAISGIAMGISWVLLFEAYRLIGVSVSTLAYYCGPVLVLVLSPLVFREKLTFATLVGFFVVVVGMVLVNGAAVLESGISMGLALGVLSAVMYAVMVICNKRAASITGLENAMCQLVTSCLVVVAFTVVVKRGGFTLSRDSVLPQLFLGIVNTGAGCYLYFSAIPVLSAQTVSICGYFEPLSALLLSALPVV